MAKTIADKESPFDGIKYSFEADSPSPYRATALVRKKLPNGRTKHQPIRKRFKTDEARDRWAADYIDEKKELGEIATELSLEQRKRWEHAQAMLEPWEDPVAIVAEWRARHPRQSSPKSRKTAAAVIDDYMGRHEFEPGFDPSIYRSHFKRFKERFGRVAVSELMERRQEIAAWIERLELASNTKRNQKTRVAVAFSEALARGEIDANPFDRLKVNFGRESRDVEFMAVDDVIELFKANFEDAALCAKLSLGLHGGLRTSAVARVEWSDFRFSLKALETPAWKTKTGSRDLIQNWPPVVWKWIARAKEGQFAEPCQNHKDAETAANWKKRMGKRWMHQKAAALKAAGLLVTRGDAAYRVDGEPLKHPPANWARHSFATYHATAFHDLALTSTLMSHAETVETLKKHYLGVVEKPEALRFFQVTPRLVERLLAKDRVAS